MRMTTLAERIAQARKNLGLSQEKLAERMNISRGACGHWERGVASPSTDHLHKLSQILDIDIHWLITGKQNNAPIRINETSIAEYENIQDKQLREIITIFFRLSADRRRIILELLRQF